MGNQPKHFLDLYHDKTKTCERAIESAPTKKKKEKRKM